MPLTVFEDVNRSTQVVFDHLPAADPLVHPCQHARIGRRINDPVRARKPLEIARATKIDMPDLDPSTLQSHPVQFTPRSNEIVKAENLRFLPFFANGQSERAPRKPADPRD